MLLGSVSQGLLHHAHCPVVVVHDEKAVAADAPVVVGVDGSPTSTAAIALAFDQASWRGVSLTAVHACGDDNIDIVDVGWPDLDALGAEILSNSWRAGATGTRTFRSIMLWHGPVPRDGSSSSRTPRSWWSSEVTGGVGSPGCCWDR